MLLFEEGRDDERVSRSSIRWFVADLEDAAVGVEDSIGLVAVDAPGFEGARVDGHAVEDDLEIFFCFWGGVSAVDR